MSGNPGFWRTAREENRRVVLSDYGVINKVWYLFPQGGGPRGSFTTFAALAPNLRNRDLIYLSGVLREQAVTPQDVFDVTILGAANRPRQATDGGVPTGGGASWLAPTSPAATTPLLKIREQGWQILNIQFAPVASSACIRLSRAEVPTDMDGSHAIISGCYFVGGGALGIGIEDVGGCSHVLVDNCEFQSLADAGVKGISTGIAVPLGWIIQDCKFMSNLNDVKMSLSFGIVQRNKFMTAGSGATNKVVSTTAVAVQGGNNHVLLNQFTNTEVQIAPGSGFTGAASDTWMNYVNDQAALAFGQPA
jgi:hypothetical protein